MLSSNLPCEDSRGHSARRDRTKSPVSERPSDGQQVVPRQAGTTGSTGSDLIVIVANLASNGAYDAGVCGET